MKHGLWWFAHTCMAAPYLHLCAHILCSIVPAISSGQSVLAFSFWYVPDLSHIHADSGLLAKSKSEAAKFDMCLQHLQEQPMAHCCEALQAGTLNLAPLASDCTAGPHNSSQIVSGFNAVPDTVAEGTCEPEQPAVGIPLLGTVVVGRPVQPLKRRGGARGPVGTRGSSQGRSRQPKQGTEGEHYAD